MLHLNPRCGLSEIFDYTFGNKCDQTENCMYKDVRDLFMIIRSVLAAVGQRIKRPMMCVTCL